MAEARRLSDEAAEAAAAAATEAHIWLRRSFAAHAEADATEADRQVRSARNLSRTRLRPRRRSKAATSSPAWPARFRERTIAELLPVAAALGIEGRSRMRHDQLVTAITRARSRESGAVGRPATPGTSGPKQGTRRPACTNRTPKKQTREKRTATKSGSAAEGS